MKTATDWRLSVALLGCFAAWQVAEGSAAPGAEGKTNGEAKTPLAGLPSKPGAHIAKIKALGDNQWMKLPPTAGDPSFTPPRQGTVRSWSPKACYAPEFGGAFITGEGGHGYIYRKSRRYSDDVVFYDLYANRWVFLYPGTHMPTLKGKMESGEYTVDKKQLGVLVDKKGRAVPIAPMSGHSGHQISYDPVQRRLIWFGNIFAYFFRDRESAKLFEKKRKEKGLPARLDCTFWVYDAAAHRFQPVSKSQLGDAAALREVKRVGWGRQVIQYVGSKKLHFYPASKADYWLDLEKMRMTVRPVVAGEPRPRIAANQYSACYDPKRDRVYMGGGDINGRKFYKDKGPGGNFFYYDVKKDRWVKPMPKGEFPLFWDIGTAFATYDTVSDRLIITVAQQRSNGGKKDPFERQICVYDPEKNEFEKPIPVHSDYPTGLGHTFFCPELNVHLFQISRDNGVGPWWAWRYKRAAEKK